ncbi:MAG: hypothetical protein NZ869_04435 [Thermoanaerobaculum sp.]|nr:hypothetical protein [Thermoanaerobaculum sp.]MDW7967081.1 hypothetical protein [Thermoanaerobaculum sp.]
MSTGSSARDLAYGGLLGAAAFVFPLLFHALGAGAHFLPMYWPLLCLPFFVRWFTSLALALGMPLLSSVLSGMPPLWPPVAPAMAGELGVAVLSMHLLTARLPRWPPWAVLAVGLAVGRGVAFVLWELFGRWWQLPNHLAGAAVLVAGLPGVVLMLLVLPPVLGLARRLGFTRVREAHVPEP